MRLIFLLLLTLIRQGLSEPLTIGLSVVAGALVSYYFSSGSSPSTYSSYPSYTSYLEIAWCEYGAASYISLNAECCGKPWIKADTEALRRDLRLNLFGQHIVENIIPSAIASVWNTVEPSKPLVMSFHGWPGNGKNFVVSFIAKHYFTKGIESNFFHFFSGRKDFGVESQVPLYQRQLQDWIKGNVTNCEYSMFVFDEVDKMPPKVLDAIKPFLDHHHRFQNVDYRKAIFIFLSNTGGTLITERYLELWRKYGKSREQMSLNDFDNILGKGAFNEKGGLQMSDLVDHHIIDHYIPFLPLEKHHVEKCIKAELDKHRFNYKQEVIDEVMQVITFGPQPELIFSKTGCKRLSQQVATIVQRERLRHLDL